MVYESVKMWTQSCLGSPQPFLSIVLFPQLNRESPWDSHRMTDSGDSTCLLQVHVLDTLSPDRHTIWGSCGNFWRWDLDGGSWSLGTCLLAMAILMSWSLPHSLFPALLHIPTTMTLWSSAQITLGLPLLNHESRTQSLDSLWDLNVTGLKKKRSQQNDS